MRCPPEREGDIVSIRLDLRAQEVVFPLLEGMYDCEHLSLVGGVIAFCRVELAAGASHQPEFSSTIFLREGGSNGFYAGVHMKNKNGFQVWIRQSVVLEEAFLSSSNASCCASPHCNFVVLRMRVVSEAGEESLVESGEP